MTDVLEDIVKKICHKLKVACEDELNNESTGFPVCNDVLRFLFK